MSFKSVQLLVLLLFLGFNTFAQQTINYPDGFISIKKFGAIGDGKTNDYPAFLAAAKYLNEKGTGQLFIPAGVYFFDTYHDGINNIDDIVFKNCSNIEITGENSVISVKGDFNRDMTREGKKHKFSNRRVISPLVFTNCKNVSVSGIEINGNVDKMTRDKGVNETAGGNSGNLLKFTNCENVTLKNIYLHHGQTDGLYINGNGNSKNFNVNNLTSSNNARQGMSIIQLTDSKFINCKFINTGITDGNYGAHNPKAGVDIEPNKKTFVVENISFSDCNFENNLGSQFVGSFPQTTSNISFSNCSFISGEKSGKYTIIVYGNDFNFTNCIIDCKGGNIYPAWKSDSTSATFSNCIIKSSGNGIVAISKSKETRLVIQDCKIIYTGNKQLYHVFPFIRLPNLDFINNSIYIPANFFRNKGTTILIETDKPQKNTIIVKSNFSSVD